MHHQYFSPETISKVAVTGSRKEFSYGVAFAVAGNLQLPSSPVESPQDYYMTNLDALARKAISVLNEVRAIDIDLVTEVVRQAWLGRYNSVFAFKEGMILHTQTALSPLCLFGIVFALSQTHLNEITENYATIFLAARVVTTAMHEHNLLA